jgi:hypothetical protein
MNLVSWQSLHAWQASSSSSSIARLPFFMPLRMTQKVLLSHVTLLFMTITGDSRPDYEGLELCIRCSIDSWPSSLSFLFSFPFLALSLILSSSLMFWKQIVFLTTILHSVKEGRIKSFSRFLKLGKSHN